MPQPRADDSDVLGDEQRWPTEHVYALAHIYAIRFGSFIAVLPLHHPVRGAQDANMIDMLHPGQCRLGVGGGYSDGDFGIDRKEAGAHMDAG